MKTWCILGGGGAFGIHTAMYLLENAAKVIGIGRSTMKPEPFSLGIDRWPGYEYQVFHVKQDLHFLLEYLDQARPEIIVNFAAQGEGAASWKHSWMFFDTNCTALVRLVEELGKRTWLERFIQIGTSELYGSVDHPVKEDAPIRPSSPYSASKAAFDFHLMAVHKHLGFPMNIIRPCNAYCPGQLLHRIIPRAIVAGVLGRKVPLHGGGRAEKSYMHARDLARAIHLVATTACVGRVFNAGPASPTSILEVVQRCANNLGIALDDLVETTDERIGQDSRYWLDSSAIKEATGWEPTIGWDEGLWEMVEWARRYRYQLEGVSTDYVLRA